MTMRILMATLAVILVALATSGCSPTSARAGVSLPSGMIYSNYVSPLSAGGRDRSPVVIPPNMTVGKSSFTGVTLNIPMVPGSRALSVGWGDGSIERALRNGNLKRVIFADAKKVNILGILERVTIRCYGEPNDPPPSPSP